MKKKTKQINEKDPIVRKKRRWHFGDRPDGWKLRTLDPLTKFTPYIMPQRSDACNNFSDTIDIKKTSKFCREKVKEGKANFSFLHVLIAGYVRMVSQRPAINRFVSGQKIYARKNIQIVMAVKKSLSLDAPETCIKVCFEPTDTVDQIYEKFNAVVSKIQSKPDEKTSFDKLNKLLAFIPGLLCRLMMKFFSFLDYFGLLPKKLLDLSPFHGSMIVTSMGSLGIRPIYHHIYNFGNLPLFFSYGVKQTDLVFDTDGNSFPKRCIQLKIVTDERICNGFYYASSFKMMKHFIENPEELETPPEQVIEDIL